MDTKGHGKHKHTQCQQCFAPKRSDKLDKTTGCCKGGSCKPGSASKSVMNFPLCANSLLGKRVGPPPSDVMALEEEVKGSNDPDNYAEDLLSHDIEGFNILSASTLNSLGQVTDKVENALAKPSLSQLPAVPLFEEAPKIQT